MSPLLRIALAGACTVSLVAAAPSGAASRAPGPPRLYSAVVENGSAFIRIFKVRPRTVSVSCADGGAFVQLTWRRWTRNSASGSGWTLPCDGVAQAVTLFVSRPVEGYFTRMTVRYAGGSPNRLGLGRVGGRLSWMAVTALPGKGPDSGPWPR